MPGRPPRGVRRESPGRGARAKAWAAPGSGRLRGARAPMFLVLRGQRDGAAVVADSCRRLRRLAYCGRSSGLTSSVHDRGTEVGAKQNVSSHAWYSSRPVSVIWRIDASSFCASGEARIVRS